MGKAVRIAVALGLCGLLSLFVLREVRHLRQREQDLASLRPDDSVPEYDCMDEKTILPARSSGQSLIDVTEAAQLDFMHTVGPLGTYFMPESIGAGAAFFDYNNDGLLDIYFVNCGQSPRVVKRLPPSTRIENRLFQQTEGGLFADVTKESGLGDTGYGAGVAVGDVDNDGFADVFIANYGQDSLYHNDGNGHFTNTTSSCGIRESEWGTAAAFFDYDRDGWLDLMVVNYTADPTYGHSVACGFQHGLVSYCGPHKFSPTIDRLYHNEGTAPDGNESSIRFRDATEEAGLTTAKTFGFGVICTDLTSDGWPDIFVANDGDANRLWVNQGNGRFHEEAVARGVAYNKDGLSEAGMGVAIGDVNGDLSQDLLVSHLSKETTTLYLADAAGGFADQTPGSGIDSASMKHTGWGAALVDLDHDGLLDLPLVNGLVIPCHSGFPFHGEDSFQERSELIEDGEAFWKPYADENLLLMGTSNARFHSDTRRGGDFTAAFGSGRGLTCGDYDNDGDIDLIVTNCGSKARLYRNDLEKHGHWLSVRAVSRDSSRDAIGAKITVRLSRDRTVRSHCVPQTSYLASHDVRVHFGLGDASRYESILVEWPDGPVASSREEFPGGDADRFVTVRPCAGRPVRSSDDDGSVE